MTATVSSHTLNGVDGTHAGGISVTLLRINADNTRDVIFQTETDHAGRLMQEIALDKIATDDNFEMVFATGAYWATQKLPQIGHRIMSEIVVRFTMPDATGCYHIPVIISPNNYSVWWSS
jgi:5-hydroxyisourate hydrolase